MACPHFHAVKPCSQTDHSRTAMLPLGDTWNGTCHADPAAPAEPDESTLRNYCNLGYARGCCTRFPDNDGPDAVRFTIAADDGESLRLYYVLERNHHPFAHGPLEFSAGVLREDPAVNAAASRLAGAYIESYRQRKAEASAR